MGSELLRWAIGTFVLLMINISVIAYGYGKLNQKVTDLCGRLKELPCQHPAKKDCP